MEQPINYAYLSGALEGSFNRLPLELLKHFTDEQVKIIEEWNKKAIEKAKQSEREYSKGL